MPLFERPPLETLASAKDRWTPLDLEHGRLEVDDSSKSTAARALLPDFVRVTQFVNADEIARGLSGFAPETVAQEAGRIMLRRLAALAQQRANFAF